MKFEAIFSGEKSVPFPEIEYTAQKSGKEGGIPHKADHPVHSIQDKEMDTPPDAESHQSGQNCAAEQESGDFKLIFQRNPIDAIP